MLVRGLKYRLIILVFLQYAVWGSYLISIGRFLAGAGLGSQIKWFFAANGMVSLFMPALIGMVAAYYVAGKWLEQFAEKVTLHPLYFIGGALVVLLIVLGVVILNCLRIAHANPVESLKNE